MGSTVIINQTMKPLDMKIGNYRYFINLTTVDKNASYTVYVDCNDTYREYRLKSESACEPLIVNSDECVDNKTIIIREVNGQFDVEMEPREIKKPINLRPATPPVSEPAERDVSMRNKRVKVTPSKWRFLF